MWYTIKMNSLPDLKIGVSSSCLATMKQGVYPFLILLSFFVLLFAYIKLAGPIPFSVSSVTTNKTDIFTVSGEGKVSIKPDIAVASVGVSVNAPSVKVAQEQMNSKINQVSESIKKLGILDKDIKTTNYSIYPNIDYQSGTQRIAGYSANTNLSIKIRNIDLVNQVIDEATKAGANQIGGVTFEVDDQTKVENEARSLAVAEAKKKAQEASKIAGFSLGRIINYSENFGSFDRPVTLSAEKIGLGGGNETSIEPGSSEVKVMVNLSYEIK